MKKEDERRKNKEKKKEGKGEGGKENIQTYDNRQRIRKEQK